jgi:hypothetical protein
MRRLPPWANAGISPLSMRRRTVDSLIPSIAAASLVLIVFTLFILP